MESPERKPLLANTITQSDDSETTQKTFMDTRQSALQENFYLPDGKNYHLFISYCNKDYILVKSLLTELEGRYDIKCAFAERDFIAGKTTQLNIADTMQKSMKILICLTPNYLESGWCDYENNVAFVMSREERRNCVIPLMLEPCQAIPQGLRVLHYIDARIEQDISGKIMEAFYHNLSTECWIPNEIPTGLPYNQNAPFHRQKNPELIRKQNGMKLLCVNAVKDVPNCILSNAWKFKPLTTEQKQQLKKDKVKLAILLYKKLLTKLNTLRFLQHFGVLFHKKQLSLIAAVMMVVSIILAVIGLLLCIIVQPSIEISMPWFIGGAIAFAMVLTVIALLWIHSIRKKEFILKLLKRKHPRILDETIETMADELIQTSIQKLWKYFLHWWDLPNCDQNRHNTFIEKQCLCQIIEEQITLPNVLKDEDVIEV